MMSSRSTHVRIERDLYAKQRELFPNMSANEIYKLGFSILSKIDKANNVIYGKRIKKR